MKKQSKIKSFLLKHLEAIILIAIWIVILCIPFFTTYNRTGKFYAPNVARFWHIMIPFVILTLINHFLLIPIFLFKNKARYFIILLVTFILFVFALRFIKESDVKKRRLSTNNFNTEQIQPPPRPMMPGQFPPNPMNRQRPLPRAGIEQPLRANLPPYVISAIIALLVIGFDTGMRSLFQWSRTEREKAIIERENIKTELAFLRNQISPHFFMNTLNNIHALIDVDTEEAKTAVIKLSNLMRHLLYESNQDLIPIEKEITFIQSYVSLMRLRFTEKVDIKIDMNTAQKETKIPPLLFTSLIENAFKYGVSYKDFSFIHIKLSTNNNSLLFEVKNSISATSNNSTDNKKHSGIGLENTRKRLDLLYPEKYSMNVLSEESIFTVQLKLPL